MSGFYIYIKSDAPGTPWNEPQFKTAFLMAAAITWEASVPTTFTSASTSPDDRAYTVSPSERVCTGLMERARPFCAIAAILLSFALSNFAFVITAPMVVFVFGAE